jgi:hypothetical protein
MPVKNIFANMKPLTIKMIEMLMDCHERELQTKEPCDTYRTQSAKGLVSRGLFTSNMFKSPASQRSYMAFYITEKGKEYLNRYASKP